MQQEHQRDAQAGDGAQVQRAVRAADLRREQRERDSAQHGREKTVYLHGTELHGGSQANKATRRSPCSVMK